MSTFTDWNGPQGAQPRGLDLYQLTEAYNRVLATLNEHITSKTAEGNVHNSKDYVDSKIAELNALITNFNRFLTRADADESYAAKTTVDENISRIDHALLDKANTAALDDYLRKNDLTSHEVVELMREDIDRLASELEHVDDWKNGEWTCPSLKASSYVEGMLKAVEQVQFTDKHITAYVGGTNLIGVYYIVGQLADKAGTAFIKYTGQNDTRGFTAAVTFVKGALTVVTDNNELKGLCFLIVENSGNRYLGVQSTDWMSQFASSDGYGLFNALDLEVSGINFMPAGSAEYVRPATDRCAIVCECLSVGPGVAFSALGATTLNTQVFREPRNPYLTLKDVNALDRVGIINLWPKADEDGVAIDFPEGYHACDGTPVLDTDDVDQEFRDLCTEYPLMDFAIIKTKSTVEVDLEQPARSSLAEAVCVLHGIKFYYGVDMLPNTAKAGEPVVVQIGDMFSVYAYTVEDGWKKYSRQYNDIDKTIAAVASVIAAEHHADVYTVYTSVSELPSGPDVETGMLGIVFDGVTYSVFKYNGTAWEVQA